MAILMKRYLTCSLLYLALSAVGFGQQITLRQIYSKAIRPDYTRYEYVFSAKNNTHHRLNLVGFAILLDAQNNELDKRYVSFETQAGKSSDSSIESDLAPIFCEEKPGKACFFKLSLEDNAMRRPLEINLTIKGEITKKPY
jgi:hypothetical protein